ncbi:Fic family protein [Lysinibacillus xylanilyticus]|uniref:Fic family protein n=1 Tax=Lysinibacillus xylanilyticus TaxID=582475 RepID=UPI003D056CCD
MSGTYKIKSFHLQDFKNLHTHLFQDIYPFAGHFRDVQLMKGSTRFCQFQFINSYASDLFYQLNNEPLHGLQLIKLQIDWHFTNPN